MSIGRIPRQMPAVGVLHEYIAVSLSKHFPYVRPLTHLGRVMRLAPREPLTLAGGHEHRLHWDSKKCYVNVE